MLWPRAKAFLIAIEHLDTTVDRLYDASLAFEKELSFFDFLKGEGNTTVHIHLRRYAIGEVAKLSPEQQAAWLDARWSEKDMLLKVRVASSSALYLCGIIS